MGGEVRLRSEELSGAAATLKVGDRVLLSGTVYTARDAAHKRFFELLSRGEPLPIPLRGSIIYYAGPTPGQQGIPVGACGPTTAGRMNPFAPRLLDLGLTGIIGKGEMSAETAQALVRDGGVYFAAVGGAGALIARCIRSAEVIAFEDLGCESVKRLTVEDLPLTVAMDCRGGNLYRTGKEQYRK